MNWKKLLNSRLHCATGTRSTCWVPVQQGDCIQRKTALFAQRRQSFLKNNPVALELRFQRNSQGTPGNTTFFNQCFDKNRLKNFVLWFLLQYGEHKTIQLVEQLKNVGFNYASKAGISLGIDDLRVPPKKGELIYEAEKQTYLTLNQYNRGEITGVERFQRLIDTWHRTSETLKQEVINHFEATDILNPVYMMAFSGARGNISQVRQLVGMRGLMADPQGQILDFPIRSNFREGLTLTEYIISSYGARKGIVDTALRTANAGYLTRRLVDVAQHVIISNFDCGTRRGIFLTNMKEGNKTIITLTQRLVGRILARDLTVVSSQKTISNYKRNEEITLDLAFEIGKKFEKVFVRSPLTCETPKLICQLCYGWSLAQGNLVSIGEAVGVVAAQSIGEPGTQLTMRTFHTGGVFSGDVSDQIRAPFNGFIEYISAIPGTLIRTPEGKIAFLTKAEGSFWVHKKEKLNGSKKYKISPYTLLYKRNAQTIFEKEVIAQISSISQKSNATDDAALTIKSENEGQFYSKSLGFYERLIGPERAREGAYGTSNDERVAERPPSSLAKRWGSLGTLALKDPGESDKIYEAWTWGYAWVLSGKIYELKIPSPLFPKLGDYVNTKSIMSETKWKFRAREPLGSTDTVRLKPVHVSSPKATQASLSAGVSSTGYLESCASLLFAEGELCGAESLGARDESATLSLAKGAQARFVTHTTSAHNSQTQARLRFAAGANALKGVAEGEAHEPVIFTTQKKISFDLAHIVFKKHGYIFQFSELHPFAERLGISRAPNRVGPLLNIQSRTLKAQTKAKGKDSALLSRDMQGLLRREIPSAERCAGPRPWGPSACIAFGDAPPSLSASPSLEAYAGTSGSHETVQANKTLLTGDYVFLDSSYSKRSPSSLSCAERLGARLAASLGVLSRSYGVEGSLVGAGKSPYYLKNSLIFQWFPTHYKTLTGGYAFIETAPPFLRLKKSLSLNEKQLFNNFSIQERSSPYLDIIPQPLNPRVSSLIHMLAPARTLLVPTHSKGGQGLSPSLGSAPREREALLSTYLASSENLESSKTYLAFGASKSQAERTLFISKNLKLSPQKMRGTFWSKKMLYLAEGELFVPSLSSPKAKQVQAKAAHSMNELLNSRMYLRIFWIPTDFFTVSERNFIAHACVTESLAEGELCISRKNLKTATLMYAFSLYRKDWLGKFQKNRQGSYKIISPSLFQYRKGFDPTVISPFEKNNIRDFMYLFFQKKHFIDPSVKGTALLMASLVSCTESLVSPSVTRAPSLSAQERLAERSGDATTATQASLSPKANSAQVQAPYLSVPRARDAVSSAPLLSLSATSQMQAMSQNSLVMKAREMRALLKNDRKKDFLRYNKIAFISFSKLVSCAPFTSSHLSVSPKVTHAPCAERLGARVTEGDTRDSAQERLAEGELNARDAKGTSRKHSNTTHILKYTSKEQVISNYLIKEYNKFSLIKNKEKFGSLLFCKSFLNSSVFKHLSPPMSLSLRVKDKNNLNIVGTLKKGWILVPCAQVCNKEAREKKAPTTARVLLGHVPAQKTLGTPRKNRGEENLSLINRNEFTFIYHKKILCPGQMISNSLKFNAPIPLLTECILLKEIFNIQQISIHSILNLKKINKKLFESSMKEDSFQKNVKENLTPEFTSRNFRNNNILASTQWIRNDKSRFYFETITKSVCTPTSEQGPAVEQGYCFDCTNTPSLFFAEGDAPRDSAQERRAPSLSVQAKRNKGLNLALILQPITEHYQENKVFLKKYVSERISTTNSSLLGTSAPKKLSDIFCERCREREEFAEGEPDELSELKLKRNQLEDCIRRGRSFQRKQPSLLSSPITQMTAVDLRLLALPAKCKRASYHTYLVNPSYNSFLKWILFKTHQWNKQNKTFFPYVGGVPNPSLLSGTPREREALGTSAKTAFNPKHDVLIIPNSLFKDLSLSGYPSHLCVLPCVAVVASPDLSSQSLSSPDLSAKKKRDSVQDTREHKRDESDTCAERLFAEGEASVKAVKKSLKATLAPRDSAPRDAQGYPAFGEGLASHIPAQGYPSQAEGARKQYISHVTQARAPRDSVQAFGEQIEYMSRKVKLTRGGLSSKLAFVDSLGGEDTYVQLQKETKHFYSLNHETSKICKKSLNFSSFLMILNNKVDKSKTHLTDISGQSRPSHLCVSPKVTRAPYLFAERRAPSLSSPSATQGARVTEGDTRDSAQAQVHMPHTVSLFAYGEREAKVVSRDEGVATLTPRNNSEEKQTFSFSYQPFSKFDLLFYPFLFLPYFSSLNINCINTERKRSKAQNHAALPNYLSLNGKELINSQGPLGERKRSASLSLSLSLGKNLDTKINSTHFYAKFKHLIPQLFENPCFSWDLISRLDSSFLKQTEGLHRVSRCTPASFKTNSKKGNSVILQNAFTLFFQELPSKKSLESISTYSANVGLATRHPHSANTKFSSMNLSSRVLCAVNTNHQRPLVSKHSKGESHFLSKPFKGSIFSFNNIGKTTAFYFMSSFAFLPQAQGTGTEFKTSFELAKTTHYSPFNGEIVYVKLKASPYLVGVEGLGTQPSYSLSLVSPSVTHAPCAERLDARDSAHLSASPDLSANKVHAQMQATSCMVLTKLDLISYYFPSFKLCTPLDSLASATRMQVQVEGLSLGTQLSYSSDSRLSATTQAQEQSQGCSLVSPTATHVPAVLSLAQALLDEPKPPIGLHASKDLSRDKKYLIKDIFIKFGRMSQKTLRHAPEACLHQRFNESVSLGSMQGLRSTQEGAREGVERDIREQIKISKLVAGFPEHNSSRRVLPLATVTQQLVSMQGFSRAVKRAREREAQLPSTHSAALSLHHRYKQSESLVLLKATQAPYLSVAGSLERLAESLSEEERLGARLSAQDTNISNKACSLLGDFLVYGDDINQKNINENLSKGVQEPLKLFTFRNSQAVQTSGQIIHYNNEKITLRRSQPIFISPKAILHKFDGDFINPKAPVITLSYKQLKTGDIIQGIPKVEQFFEARTTKRGHLFRDSLPSLLKGLFKRFLVFLPLDLAVRQSIYKIQQIIVDGVLRVYKSQGVTIADKHLEVIVKQMTGKVRILEGAQTGFFPGEVLDLCFVEKINRFLIKKVTYEPLVLGITKASLEVESFLSAASFQQTTRVLSQAALYRKKDFLKGLKENVILGNLIPAGTGYLVFLDDVTASVVSP